MPWRLQSEPTLAEKVCGGLSYFTFGVVGLIYQVFFTKDQATSQLFRFHFFQSIVLSLLSMLVAFAAQPLLDIVFKVLFAIVPALQNPVSTVVVFGAMALQGAFTLVLAYGAIWCFLGKFAEVPFISDIVRQNMR